jgi:hypothetical protein
MTADLVICAQQLALYRPATSSDAGRFSLEMAVRKRIVQKLGVTT